MGVWNSQEYLRFKNERTQPSIDLVNRIPMTNPKSIIDIGCGPGNSSNVLHERFYEARILGVDNSEDMINTAENDYPQLEFLLHDASKGFNYINEKFDIVFSNACIQWIPDHKNLLKNMMNLLNEDGFMAIQTPMNYDEPIHKIIGMLASSDKWKDKFDEPRIFYNLTPSEYYDLLSEISSDFNMWNTTYFHRMTSHQSIMDWYKGTGLRPYLSALNYVDRANFEHDVLDEVIKAYPVQMNGEIIFRFPRLFFIAKK